MKHYPVEKTEAEWRAQLTPEEYHVLREKGTERPFTNEFWRTPGGHGRYFCRACDQYLFSGEAKFVSSCGWPAFYEAVQSGAVEEHVDRTFGMTRTEVVCNNCGSHLGHVFEDAPHTPTGLRYCINSICLRFEPDAA